MYIICISFVLNHIIDLFLFICPTERQSTLEKIKKGKQQKFQINAGAGLTQSSWMPGMWMKAHLHQKGLHQLFFIETKTSIYSTNVNKWAAHYKA